jgi:hypothetical protein
VSLNQSIAWPSSDVWTAISTPGILELCHPFCQANPVTVWPGAESRDEIHYFNGKVHERRFLERIEGVGYSLEIGEHGQETSLVRWRVKGVDRTASILDITVYPYLHQSVPRVVRWLPHVGYLRPMLRRYLTSVVSGSDWYLTQREPVPRNQLDPHRWFSPNDQPTAIRCRP